MRWKAGKGPEQGDRRVIRRFLLFPRCIKKEWRWLEFATWEQRYDIWVGSLDLPWVDERWID